MKLSIILVLFIASSAVCFGADLTQEIKTPDGFTIRLPSNWTAIPKDVLDAYSDAVAKMAPNVEKQTYAYGFQLSSAQNWLTYPYILIQVKRTGRVPEAQLKSIKQVQQGLDKGIAKAQDSMSKMVSDARFGETIYDPTSHILFTQIGMDVKEVGLVKGLIALLLTEEGMIQIAGYAKATEFADSVPIFEGISRGVIIEDHLKYQSRISDAIPVVAGINWGNVLSNAIRGAIIGGAIALITGLFRKKKAIGGKDGGSP